MSDLIDRQAAIDELEGRIKANGYSNVALVSELNRCIGYSIGYIMHLPSAQPEYRLDEWCTDCKEYDKERHCCPRWNRVIRDTLQDVQAEQPEIVRCKDCKHLFDGEHNANCCEVLMRKAKWLTEITVDTNWFCADGERRTDE